MDAGRVAMRFVVFGRVQGVGFRDAVHRVARALGGLRGHVRNLRDGSVEVCVAGEREKVDAVRDFLGKGPMHARVDRVDAAPCEAPEGLGPFTVLFW